MQRGKHLRWVKWPNCPTVARLCRGKRGRGKYLGPMYSGANSSGLLRFVWGKVRALESRWLEGPGASRGQLANQNSLIGGRFRLVPYPSTCKLRAGQNADHHRCEIALIGMSKITKRMKKSNFHRNGKEGSDRSWSHPILTASGNNYNGTGIYREIENMDGQYGHIMYSQYSV